MLGTSAASDLSRSVLGAELYFLFHADEQYVGEKIFPLLEWSSHPVHAEQIWQGFLFRPRMSDRMLDGGFAGQLYMDHVFLDRLTPKTLVRQYYELLATVLVNYDVGAEKRDDILGKMVSSVPPQITDLLREISALLYNISETGQADSIWEQWLGGFVRRRLNNVPRPPSYDELCSLASLAVSMRSQFSDAVEVILAREVGFGADEFHYCWIDDQLAIDKPESVFKYLHHLLTNTSSPIDPLVARRVDSTVNVIASHITPRQLNDLVNAALACDLSAAIQWLEASRGD
jgi:hypothetical protein